MAGNVAKRANGKWRARYRNEEGRELTKSFDTKKAGQRWLDEVTASIVSGQYVDPGRGQMTFASFYAEWSPRMGWAPGTVLAMDLAAASVPFADEPISKVRRSHIEHWVRAMEVSGGSKGRPLAASTIHTRVANVRRVFRAAVTDQRIAADPTVGVKLPRKRLRAASMEIPSPEDVKALLEAAGPSFRAFLSISAFTGLRLGEVAGLQVGDIDFMHRVVHVRRQVQRVTGGGQEIRLPKNGSERSVPLPASVQEILAEHVRLECPTGAADRWLFHGSTSLVPPHQNTVHHQWARTLRAAGLPNARLHNLRHFYASGLISMGCDVVTVQRALGHAKATTTLETYTHLWINGEERTREASQRMFDSMAAGVKAKPLTS